MSSQIMVASLEYLAANGNFNALIYEKVPKERTYITSSFIGLIFKFSFRTALKDYMRVIVSTTIILSLLAVIFYWKSRSLDAQYNYGRLTDANRLFYIYKGNSNRSSKCMTGRKRRALLPHTSCCPIQSLRKLF